MTRRGAFIPVLLLAAAAVLTWWVAREMFRDADPAPEAHPAASAESSAAAGEGSAASEPATAPGPTMRIPKAVRRVRAQGPKVPAEDEPSLEPPSGSAWITLRVLDEITRAPVIDAEVVVGEWTYRLAQDATMRLPFDPPLLMSLAVRAPRYCSAAFRLVDESLDGSPDLPSELELLLPPTAGVEGTLRKPDGAPPGYGIVRIFVRGRRVPARVPESEFVVRRLDGSWECPVEEGGAFRLGGLPAGISLIGQGTVEAYGHVFFPSPFKLQPGECRRFELMSPPNGVVNGRVVDHLGRPMPHVRIHAEVRRGDSVVSFNDRWSRSDKQGRFRVSRVPAGLGTLTAMPTTSSPLCRIDFAPTQATFAIRRHQEDVNCTIVVHPGLAIRGRVICPAGAPRQGVRVELHAAPAAPRGRLRDKIRAFTDAGGAFVLTPLAPGEHTVVARGFAEFGDSKPTKAKAGAEEVLLKLTRACSIEGVVRDAASGAPARGRVRLWPRAERVAARVVDTDREGRFRFERVPAGEFDLTATTWTGRQVGARPGIRIVERQGVRDVVILLHAGGALRLDGADDQVIEDLVVEVGGGVVHREASVRPADLVTMTVPPGRVRVRGQLSLEGKEAREALDRTLEVIAGETITLDLTPN